MVIQDHLSDIDFRSREVRQAEHLQDFTTWYKQLYELEQTDGYDDYLHGQLTMLSSVLWYLLPPKEYKQLTTVKKGLGI